MSPASARGQAAGRPHISEWFGHRVFPEVSGSAAALADWRVQRCPFLTLALNRDQRCVKAANSQGVCTISAVSNGPRQDWLVCPYRALDNRLLEQMVGRLFRLPSTASVVLAPVVNLADEGFRDRVLHALATPDSPRHFLYFQDKLGGEISLPRTTASPELSFDITIVELLADGTRTVPVHEGPAPAGASLQVGKYGVIELQTTDTHGSYREAVSALRGALDLHPNDFAAQVANNPEWAGRKIEGPNISNVFKRTFYQTAFKFQVTKRSTSVGCVLALPRPVWDSWQPFLGAPTLREQSDGTWRLLDDRSPEPTDWIYVFDIDEKPAPDGGPAPLHVWLVIGTDAATLSRAALDVAPAKAVEYGGADDAVRMALIKRLGAYLPGLARTDTQRT
ncbi:MAG TPA: hypothetical protein VG276_10045 [Actinomycetes bacterium]|nr:hypothetical protein [Actinomycetes bacterium]